MEGRLDRCKLTVNQVLSKTRRRKGELVPRFQFGPPKTEKSRRTVELSGVRSRCARGRTQVFDGTPGLSWNTMAGQWACLSVRDRHAARRTERSAHTHASLLIHEGVHPKRISERLGHSSIKLTMDTYGHLFEGCDRDSAAKMEKLLAPKRKHSDAPVCVLLAPKAS